MKRKKRMKRKKIWYQRTSVIILCCLLVPPLGLFMLWKFTKLHKVIKIIITPFILFWTLALGVSIFMDSPEKQPIEPISMIEATATPIPTTAPTATPVPTETLDPTDTPIPEPMQEEPTEEMVWIPQSGSKYHSRSTCSGMNNPTEVPLSQAQAAGYAPCKRCY